MTLAGVHPNDTVAVPIRDYECTTGSFELYWNISGDTVDIISPKPPGKAGISINSNGNLL